MSDRNDQEKSLSTMNKTITIKEHILNYAKNERYFNINDLRNYFTEQIKGFFHHRPSQFVTFIYADKDFLHALKDFLTDKGYNTYLNPRKSETEK
jgi:hypothetical protein